jgi:ABC-type transport system involved in multi-copper enzyme maturation permease subunit
MVISALTFWGQDSVETWTWNNGAAADSVGTCFFLPFITGLIATPIVRSQLKSGTAPRISASDIPRWTHRMGGPLLLRAAKVGIAGMLLFAVPVYAAYFAFAPDSIETVRFIAMKSLSAGVFGVLATPLIAFVAMCEKPER